MYQILKVLEADYKPTDGEPFCVTWGAEGWVVWCRTAGVTVAEVIRDLQVPDKVLPLTVKEKRVAGLAKAREVKRLKRAK
jgi:hypothetical protein